LKKAAAFQAYNAVQADSIRACWRKCGLITLPEEIPPPQDEEEEEGEEEVEEDEEVSSEEESEESEMSEAD